MTDRGTLGGRPSVEAVGQRLPFQERLSQRGGYAALPGNCPQNVGQHRSYSHALRDRLAFGPARFYLVVPERHANSLVWTDHRARAEARRHLHEARARFFSEGVMVDGEVGDTNPVYTATAVLGPRGPRHVRRDNPVDDAVGVVEVVAPRCTPTSAKATNLPVFHVEANVARV